MGPISEIDPEGDPRLILEAYREFIVSEIKYADRERWALVEERLELADILELIAWIISPWTGPISEIQTLVANKKALEEAAYANPT
jgi:hypothetical protein